MTGALLALLLIAAEAGSVTLPRRLTPESMRAIEEQLPRRLREPAWDKLAEQSAGLPDTDVARFVRALAALRQRAVWRGEEGLVTLEAMAVQAEKQADPASQWLAAHLRFTIGRGKIWLGDHATGREQLRVAAERLRRLHDGPGLVRALTSLADSILSHSRQPHDALPVINELLVLVEQAGLKEHRDRARQLQDLWHQRLIEVDDHFGRAERRVHYFPPSVGIPVDADLTGVVDGVLIMNGDSDDQMEAAPPQLAAFDGLFLRTLDLPDDTLELRTSLVTPDGELWVGTNRGLYSFVDESFVQYVNAKLGDEQENRLIEALQRDTSTERRHAPLLSNIVNEVEQGPDRRLYLATSKGLSIWDPAAGTWEHVTSKEAPLPEKVERVAPAPDGSMVVAWAEGFATRAPDGTWRRRRFEFSGQRPGTRMKNWLVGLLVDSDGQPWVHGLGGAQALHHHTVTREVDWRFHDMTSTINHVLKTSDGVYWYATPSGVCRQSGSTCDALGAQRWMAAPWSLDLLEWPEENVWVTVYQGGLYRILPPSYRHITMVEGFVQPMISGLAVAGPWMYFANPAGVTRYDPRTGELRHFISNAEGVPKDLEAIIPLRNGLMALAGIGVAGGKGVVLFDGMHGDLLTPSDGLADETIKGICEVSDGVLLAVTSRTARLIRSESRDVSEAPVEYQTGDLVEGVACAPGEPTWVWTHGGGLYRVDGGQRQRVDTAGAGLQGELQQVLRSETAGIFLLGERNILRDTEGGLVAVDLNADQFDFRVRDVLEDPSGLLYFSTESGVFMTNGENWTRIGTEDGLVSDTSFDMRHFHDALLVVGQGGVTVWKPPALAPPETLLIAGDTVWLRSPTGEARRLLVSTGVASAGRVLIRSLAGLFEVEAGDAGPFLPASAATGPATFEDPCAAESVERVAVPHRWSDLRLRLTGAVPFASFEPDELHYWYRVDGGDWLSAKDRVITLRGLADGLHVVEARATGPYLRRDPTPARYCVEVDTPIPLWAIVLPIGVVLGLGGWQRRRLRTGYEWLRYARGFTPIDRSPFTPGRPARGPLFVGRDEVLSGLQSIARSGGAVVALCAERGLGKSSILAVLADRLRAAGSIVIESDLAMATAGANVGAVIDDLAVELEASLNASELAAALRALPAVTLASIEPEPGRPSTAPTLSPASLSDESNAFRRLDSTLERLERASPSARVAILLNNAEVLGLAADADAAHGSYLFPFLRGLAQHRSNVALFLSLEGRWFDLARRFDDLLAFATAIPIPRLDAEASAKGFGAPLRDRALILPVAMARLVDESGGHPYLIQLLGHHLVALLNERQTNVCVPSMVDELAERVLRLPDARLPAFWATLNREERLLVAALCERLEGSDRAPLDTVVSWLSDAGVKLLQEEARRAVIALQRSTTIDETGHGLRVCSGLFRRWVRARHTIATVFEESYDYVGQYRLLERIGGGGMGVVYKARDLVHGNTVAVKLLRSELSESKRNRRRFLREARLGKRLQHPHIVRILDYGDQEGRLYLAMEFVEGDTLTWWARNNRATLDAAEAMRMGIRIASAIDAIHKAGILHRDIKSDNVMVTSSPAGAILAVKLMDFGLAVGEDVSRMTHAGAVLGTVGYMSPEQALGKDLSPRSDLYSLGVVLYELCCGRLPFEAPDPAAALRAIVDDPVPSLGALCPAAPPELVSLVTSLLAKDPEQRPSDAAEVVRRLEAVALDTKVETVRAPLAESVEPARTSSSSSAEGMLSRTLVELRSESLLSLASSVDSRASAVTQGNRVVALHRVSAAVAQGIERNELFRECLRHVVDGVGAVRGAIGLKTDSNRIEFPAVLNLQPEVARSLLERAIHEESGFLRAPEEGVRAAVCAPVWVADRVLGAILAERDDGREFGEEALELVVSVGYLLGLATERDRLLEEILASERLAAVGNMLAGVAHDFKNPLTVIGAFAELAVHETSAPKRAETYAIIQRSVDAMTEMVADLLAFARGERDLTPSMVDVAVLAADLEDRLRVRCSGRDIELAVESKGGRIRIDAGRARRIVINLAENAIAALRAGSRIHVSLAAESQRIRICVSDNGPGIPEKVRERMFEPFVSAGGSTGLGLAIVRKFVDDHGGSIEVQSMEGEGTSFVIELPELPT